MTSMSGVERRQELLNSPEFTELTLFPLRPAQENALFCDLVLVQVIV